MVSPNHHAKRGFFDASKSPMRKRGEGYSKENPNTSTPISKNKGFKSPNSSIRDVLCSNKESSFENLLKKSATKEFKSVGQASTNDRSRSSFKTYKNDDFEDKSDVSDVSKELGRSEGKFNKTEEIEIEEKEKEKIAEREKEQEKSRLKQEQEEKAKQAELKKQEEQKKQEFLKEKNIEEQKNRENNQKGNVINSMVKKL